MNNEEEDFIKWTSGVSQEALEIMAKNHFVLDDLENPWQKLALTFYTQLVEVSDKAKQVLEESK